MIMMVMRSGLDFEHLHFIFCSSFQHLRLGGLEFMLPKRRCWKAEPTFPNEFPREALFNES